MAKRTKQVNIRFNKEEHDEIKGRASERKQKVSEFLRDLLRYGIIPEIVSRR